MNNKLETDLELIYKLLSEHKYLEAKIKLGYILNKQEPIEFWANEEGQGSV